MCGFKAVVVRCDELGYVDLSDLETKLNRYSKIRGCYGNLSLDAWRI